jgi:cysteine desulfurase
MGIYLDYNATTPIDERVLTEMVDVYRNSYGNADSRTHDYGENARKIVDKARERVANLLSVDKGEVFFTSGSTESSNIAIQGLKSHALKTGKKHVITSAIEHKAVLSTVKSLEDDGFEVDVIKPEEDGRISFDAVVEKLREDTLLVSLMHANNETGIIQPVEELGELLATKGIFFHVDATQTCGKLVPELKKVKYDMLSMSAHKMYGPQGVGALILKKKRYKLPPVKAIMYGGQQEHGIRPGTTPVALVAGLGKACELAELEYGENSAALIRIKEAVLKLIENSGLEYTFNGDQNFCLSNTINVSFKGVESEALMLSSKQYCGISNGSACTSHDYSPSYVLKAMGLDEERLSEAIRISWGPKTVVEEMEKELNDLLSVAKGLAG